MNKRDLKVKHLKTMIAIAMALKIESRFGKEELELSGPGLKKKAKNIFEWSIQQIKINENKIYNLTKENDHFAAQLEEKNQRLAILETKFAEFSINPEELVSYFRKPSNPETVIKFDIPAQINSDFKSDDSLLEKAKEPFTPRTEKTEVEPATFNKVSEIPISDFKKTGLLLLVNQVLHAFGIAIVVESFKDEPNIPVRMFPARVKFRGFELGSVNEAYENIGLYLNKNAKLLYNETGDDHDFQPDKTQF